MTNPDPERRVRYVDVEQSEDGQYYFVVKAGNNEPVYSGETYPEQDQAIGAAVREHTGRSDDFEYILRYDKGGQRFKTALNDVSE